MTVDGILTEEQEKAGMELIQEEVDGMKMPFELRIRRCLGGHTWIAKPIAWFINDTEPYMMRMIATLYMGYLEGKKVAR